MNHVRTTELAKRLPGSPGPLRISRAATLLWGTLACLCMAGPLCADESPELQHRQAVSQARAGEFNEAIQSLTRLRSEYPSDRSLLLDQTLVLAWAGRDREVVENSSLIDQDGDPVVILNAVAKSLRNIQKFSEASDWYHMAIAREPEQLDARLGLAMTLADAGQFKLAQEQVDAIALEQQQTPGVLEARLYLMQKAGRQLESLSVYDELLATDPQNNQALRNKTLLLRSLLLPEQALAIAQQHPGLLSQEEILGLEADRMALSIRNAARTPYPPPDERRGSEQAVARLNQYLAEVPPGSTIHRKLRYDRLVALADRNRSEEAVQEYESLLAESAQLPAYVRFSAARAYLHVRQPEKALALLDGCLEENPGSVDVQIQRIHALGALERHEEAMEIADLLLRNTPEYQQLPGSLVRKPNDQRVQAEIRAILARAYADRLGESQQRLEVLTSGAPNNTDARHELGSIYLWRGWPDKALAEYEQALAVDPDLLVARTGWTATQLERQDYPAAGQQIADLRRTHPDEPLVQWLDKRWHLHERSQLILEARAGNSSGTTFGSDQYEVQGWWYSPPFEERFRFYGHSFDASAEFPEGKVIRRRLAAGAEYRRPYWTARTELSGERFGGGDTGLLAQVDWRLDDRWSLGASAELNSYDTPLRAYANDIQANRLALAARFRPNELGSMGASTWMQSFDDGNTQTGIGLDSRWRLLSREAWRLDGTAALGSSRSSLDNALYFNPSGDRTAVLGADARWTAFKRYERVIYHRLRAQLGSYWQQSFGSDGTWALEYEFDMRLNSAWGLRLGLQRTRNVYDGNPEYGTFFLASLEGRL